MAAILASLRKQTNGAVTDSMCDKGVVWPLNYGVAVPAIRHTSAHYAPDHQLGKLLYSQQVRELRLAGIMIADPHCVTVEELPFWESGIINTEVAEHLSFLLSAARAIPFAILEWIGPDRELAAYAALLSATRKIVSERSALWVDPAMILNAIRSLSASESLFLWRSAAALLNALYRFSPPVRGQVEQFVEQLLSTMSASSAGYLREELFLDGGQREESAV